jgi:hypothetical protein
MTMPRPAEAFDCPECPDSRGTYELELEPGDPGYQEWADAYDAAERAYLADDGPPAPILDQGAPTRTVICEDCGGRGWQVPMTAEEEAAKQAGYAARMADAEAEHIALAHPNGELAMHLNGRTCKPGWCPLARGEWGEVLPRSHYT